HLAGDDALKRVAGSIAGRIRASDRLYRYGGEELLLLLPETGLDGAEILVERIMASVREAAIPHCQSPYGVITLSCGIVSLPDWSDGPCTWRDVVAMADREMYRSKETGRNRASSLRPRTLGDDLMTCLMGTAVEPLLSGA
ncbi:MAG TPA: diguanylate cyclase, partial [Geobacteraceae bacterium]